MKRLNLQCLIVGDDDLECKKYTDLEQVSMKFDLIIYKGRLGRKVLRIQGI